MTNKKICMLSSAHSVFDDRIFYKEAKSLSKEGYNVAVIAQHDKEEVVDNIRIIPLSIPKNRLHRMTKTVWKLFMLALKEKADIYHFHDPELIPIGILLKLKGTKVIYDVHEDYTKTILDKNRIGNEYFIKFIAFLFNLVEQTSIMFFNKIIVVTTHIAKKYPKNKTIILRNLVILEVIDNIKVDNYKKSKPNIIYFGGLSENRGIIEIICAMKYLYNKADLLFLGRWENEEYKRKCMNLKEWKNVKYFGYVSYAEMFSIIKKANIGLINFYPKLNHIRSLPSKLFSYMACSLPMVVSNFDYWQKLFGECALFADPYNPKDIANKILYLLDNPDVMKKMGERGRELIKEKYSWESESKKLLDMYKKF